jgi:hypothetical protein
VHGRWQRHAGLDLPRFRCQKQTMDDTLKGTGGRKTNRFDGNIGPSSIGKLLGFSFVQPNRTQCLLMVSVSSVSGVSGYSPGKKSLIHLILILFRLHAYRLAPMSPRRLTHPGIPNTVFLKAERIEHLI